MIYVFDAARFKGFEELKQCIAHRVALSINPSAGDADIRPPTDP